MKRLATYFINGVVTIVPIILVLYVIYKVFNVLDGILGQYLRKFMEESYVPGIGLLLTLVVITMMGWLTTQYISGKVVEWLDYILERIPLVKTLYSIIKDTFQSLLGEKKSFSKVALVKIPGSEMKSVGFITSEEVGLYTPELKGHIAVYIPQTFQVAGFTFMVPEEDVEYLDMKAEDAMKLVISGGISNQSRNS